MLQGKEAGGPRLSRGERSGAIWQTCRSDSLGQRTRVSTNAGASVSAVRTGGALLEQKLHVSSAFGESTCSVWLMTPSCATSNRIPATSRVMRWRRKRCSRDMGASLLQGWRRAATFETKAHRRLTGRNALGPGPAESIQEQLLIPCCVAELPIWNRVEPNA